MSDSDQPAGHSRNALHSARSAFDLARGEFRATEDEFLAVLDQLWENDVARIRNLAALEGLRMQLMESFNVLYRSSVNNLVDALFASIGEPPVDRSDGRSFDGHDPRD